MQKRTLSVLAASVIAVILFSSCSKTNKQGRYIPVKAGAVFHLNGKSINEKLTWDEIRQNEAFKDMSSDSSVPAYAKVILNNPDSSGLDIKNDIEIFIVKDSAGGYAGVEGFIKDKTKFKQFLGNAHKDAKETTKDGYTYLTDMHASVAYNDDKFFVAINVPQMATMGKMPSMDRPTDSAFGGIDEIKYDRDMAGVAASLVSLKEDESLAKDDHFTELMKTTGDVHMFYNAQYLNAAGNLGAMSAMVNMDKVTNGAQATATVNFDNGKINIDLKSYGSKELTDLMKKYSAESFDKTMVKNIPSKNLAGLFAFSFKPEGLKEFLKLMNLDGLANIALAQMGFNLDDFVQANKGDLVFAVTDIKKDSSAAPTAQYLFAASIADKNAFNKLITAGKKIGGPMMGNDASNIAYNTNDKYFVLSNNKDASDTYLAGTANNSFAFLDNISGGPMGGYVNFQYIMNSMKPTDSLQMQIHDASLKLWDNMMISGGNFSDGGIKQHWEINLVDKNTNSLKQLNTYAGIMSAIEKKQKEKDEAMWRSEDVINPAFKDTSTMVPGTK